MAHRRDVAAAAPAHAGNNSVNALITNNGLAATNGATSANGLTTQNGLDTSNGNNTNNGLAAQAAQALVQGVTLQDGSGLTVPAR